MLETEKSLLRFAGYHSLDRPVGVRTQKAWWTPCLHVFEGLDGSAS